MNKTKMNQKLGSKKIAPVNMRKNATQFIIDGYTVEEVLKQIPDGIKILGAKIECYKSGASRKIHISNALRKLGVTYIREFNDGKNIVLNFDETTPSRIKQNVKLACNLENLSYEKAIFKTLLIGNNEATGLFHHCTKEVRPDDTDLRKKMRVLGLISGQGKVHSLIQDIGAKKFHCSFKEETVRIMVCER